MVDNPLVIVTLQSVLGTSAKLDVVQIGAGRAIGAGNGSADKLSAVIVQRRKRRHSAAHKLMLIAQHKNRLPNLF